MDALREVSRTRVLACLWVLGWAVAAAVVCAAVLLWTSPGLPMAWDEGNAIVRAEGIARGQWEYTTRREGHPAFYGIVIAAGQRVSAGWFDALGAARFGPIMLFGVAAGAMFYRMRREYSAAAAIGAVAALMLMPRVFAHAHFASFDGPLTSCWVLTWATFAPRQKVRLWAVPWGIALGMTLSCKATGWIAPVPFLIWALLYRDRLAAKALAVGLPVAVATFFALNPPLWDQPIHGWKVFFELNLNRAANPGLNISTWFLGRMYNLDYPLPWYNTIFWTAVTVPLGLLGLAAVGIVSCLRRWRIEPAGTLLLLNWMVLLVIRALPMAPPHDGVRLFLPSFAFLAAIAGVGCARVLSCAGIGVGKARIGDRGEGFRVQGLGSRVESRESRVESPGAASSGSRVESRESRVESAGAASAGPRVQGRESRVESPGTAKSRSLRPDPRSPIPDPQTPRLHRLWSRGFAVVAVALVYVGSASSLLWYAPQWLSYYNLLIGGLPGATAMGMEPTYYWDALDRSLIDWLHEHTPADEKIRFGAPSTENLALMQRWRTLRRQTAADAPGSFRWYVLQHRPSAWQPADVWLIEHGRPAYCKAIRPSGFGPWRLDVPLVSVYEYEQYLGACQSVRGQ